MREAPWKDLGMMTSRRYLNLVPSSTIQTSWYKVLNIYMTFLLVKTEKIYWQLCTP